MVLFLELAAKPQQVTDAQQRLSFEFCSTRWQYGSRKEILRGASITQEGWWEPRCTGEGEPFFFPHPPISLLLSLDEREPTAGSSMCASGRALRHLFELSSYVGKHIN